MLITISGLYGSGGQEIAEALAQHLGYTLHGKELMEKATANSGVDLRRSTLDFYDETDETIDARVSDPFNNALLSLQLDVLPIGRTDKEQVSHTINTNSGLLSSYMDTLPISRREPAPVSQKIDIDRLKFAQAKTILDAAESGNGIFTGRCASYVLSGRNDVLRIFTTASLDSCRERIAQVYGLEAKSELDSFIQKTNLRRAYYYEAFTGAKWDAPENYDYCINTDCLGFDKTLELVKALIELKSK